MNVHASPNLVNDNSIPVEVSSLPAPPYRAAALPPHLEFYRRHGAALFPLPSGSKTPGSVAFWPAPENPERAGSFLHHCSRDPLQWAEWWRTHRCNFGAVASASNWITLDIDVKKQGEQTDAEAQAEAWQAWADLCKSWGYADALPAHIKSAHGGFHVYFKLRPGDPDPSTLRQPDAVAQRINVRVRGYTIAAGSHFEGRPYELLANAAPYDRPDALLQHCMPVVREVSNKVGKLDIEHCKKLYEWLGDNRAIASDEQWRQAGMAARLEFGDAGLELWQILAQKLFNEPVDAENETRWRSFKGNGTTMNTIFKLARDAGWKGSVPLAAPVMFEGGAEQAAIDLAKAAKAASDNSNDDAAPKPPVPYTGPLPPTTEQVEAEKAAEKKAKEPPLRVISAASFANKPIPEREMLVEGLIPAKIVAGLYGEGAVGKSLLALMLAVACVIGGLFLGYRVKKGPIIYLCCEDDEDEVHRRLAGICKFLNIDMAALGDLYIVALADEDAVLAATDGRSEVLTTTYRYDQVVGLAEKVRPVLVIGDTLADVLAATENSRMIAKQFVRKMRPLAVPYGGTFLVLAHPSLSGINTGRGSSGTTGWRNTFRWDGFLHKVLDEGGRETDPSNRVLSVMKANYGPQNGEIPLRYVDAGAYMLDTTRLASSGGDPLVADFKAEKLFLELLKKYIGQNRYVSTSEGKSYAPAVFAPDAAAEGVNKKQLKSAMERLLEKGKIENAPHGAPSKKQFRLFPR